MRIRSILCVCLLATFSLFTLEGGCGGTSSSDLDDDNVKDPTGICFGRVIDRSTQAGISGAVVEIYAGSVPSDATNASDLEGEETNFVVRTTAAADDADTTLFDETGMWRIENLPNGDTYRVRFGASGYATMQATCDLATSSSFDNTPIAEDMQDIPLVKSASATVTLSNSLTGGVVASCPIFAVPAATGEAAGTLGQNVAVTLSGVEITATTDANGQATLTGLNPLIDYTIVAAACDQNGDNIYDFQTAFVTLEELIDTNAVFNVAVLPAQADDTPTIIASNCTQFGPTEDPFMAGCAVATSGALVYIFDYPVQSIVTGDFQLVLDSEATFVTSSIAGGLWGGSAVDFDGDDQTATDTAVDQAITAALSAGNTVLTVTPSAALTANGVYTLEGTVTASVPGQGVVGNVRSLDFVTLATAAVLNNELIYAFPAGDASITDPTADNYNADDDLAATTSPVCLEFAEPVIGTVQVLATVADGTTAVAQNLTTVNLNTGSLINESDNADGVCGGVEGCPTVSEATCTAAGTDSDVIKYAVPLCISLSDHRTAANNSVTVYIDAMDYAGNQLQEELTLQIQ